MASLFRPNISTYQLPGGKHRTPDGKRITKNTPGAVKATKRSTVWYGRYRTVKGETVTEPLCSNKTSAKEMLAKLIVDAKMQKSGLMDADIEDIRKTPLADHLEAYRRHLEAKGNCPEHVKKTVANCQAVLTDCRFVHFADLNQAIIEDYLHDLRRDPRRPGLPVGKEWFSKRELIEALGGIKPTRLANVMCGASGLRQRVRARPDVTRGRLLRPYKTSFAAASASRQATTT